MHRFTHFRGGFFAVALITFCAPLSAQPIRAGVGVADITPDTEAHHVPLGGYGDRENRPALGVHDSTLSKTLILEQGERRFALVAVDLQGPTRSLREEVLERIAGTGIDASNLLIAGSHSHASLEMNTMHRGNTFGNRFIGIFDEALLLFTAERIAESIHLATRELVPVRLGSTSVRVPGMNRNRRGDDVVDERMTLLSVETMDRQRLAVVVNYAAHPTFMSARVMHVSAGWPGYLQRELEGHLADDVVVLYTNGAEGDLSPTGATGPSEFARAEDYGRKLAVHALAAIPAIETREDVTLTFVNREVELPPRTVPPALMESAGPEYGLTPDNLLAILEQMNPEATTLMGLRLGDWAAISIPGEMAAALGLEIKDVLQQGDVRHPVIVGLANEWISYILSKAGYHGGGYEPGVSFYGENLGPEILQHAKALGRELVTEP